MDEQRTKAFDFASDSTKQLITLATGILTVTVTVVTAFRDKVPEGAKVYLEAAWILYVVSVVFGAATLLALTGTLEPKTRTANVPSIRGGNVVLPSAIQVICFLAGTIVAVVAGIKALR